MQNQQNSLTFKVLILKNPQTEQNVLLMPENGLISTSEPNVVNSPNVLTTAVEVPKRTKSQYKAKTNKNVAERKKKVSRKKNSFSIDQKIDLLDRLKNEKVANVSRSLNIPSSTLMSLKRKEDKVRKMHGAKSSSALTRKVCHNVYLLKMEKVLLNWIQCCIADKIELSQDKVRQKSLEIYGELPIENGEAKPDFRASNGWISRFKAVYFPHYQTQKIMIGKKLKTIVDSAPEDPLRIFHRALKLFAESDMVIVKPLKGIWKELLENEGNKKDKQKKEKIRTVNSCELNGQKK